jgi:hypothetical protein
LRARFVYRVTAVLAERPSAEYFDESLPRHPLVATKGPGAHVGNSPETTSLLSGSLTITSADKGHYITLRAIACTFISTSSYDPTT